MLTDFLFCSGYGERLVQVNPEGLKMTAQPGLPETVAADIQRSTFPHPTPIHSEPFCCSTSEPDLAVSSDSSAVSILISIPVIFMLNPFHFYNV